jgi:hypothetical protein
MFDKAIVLDSSPVEFAIVGPFESRDRILVRSEKAGLDLIGLAAQSGLLNHDREPEQKDLFSTLFFWDSRQLNMVKSSPMPDVASEDDSRNSHFSFVWNGLSSSSGVRQVEESFKLQLQDLHSAIRTRDIERVEWAIAPVIYGCVRASDRRLRFRRILWSGAVAYVALIALAIALASLQQLLKLSAPT